MLPITVLVPTYRRPKDLAKCLTALKQQTRTADEVLVIVRDSDRLTQEFLQTFEPENLPLQVVSVNEPGQVAALNRGLEQAQGEIISITDDDGVPYPQWLERIESHFLENAQVGGVGGRDWMYVNQQLIDGQQSTVGKVQWFGRTIGNHHLGFGQPRSVEILKGANMSYRRQAIAEQKFDARLLGTGAEVHNDLAFGLTIKKKGWQLIYDPQVAIDHYHGQRFDEDRRGEFNAQAWCNEVHNKTLVMLEYLPLWRSMVFITWAALVGSRRGYGLVQVVRFLPQEKGLALKKWGLSLMARWQGIVSWLAGAPVSHQSSSLTSDSAA